MQDIVIKGTQMNDRLDLQAGTDGNLFVAGALEVGTGISGTGSCNEWWLTAGELGLVSV
jgi:hypothetical protein